MAQDAYGKVPARELQPRAEFAEPPRMAETRMTIAARRCPGADVQPHLSRAVLCHRRARRRPKGWRPMPRCWAATRPPTLYRVLVEQKKLATDAGASYDGYARDAGEFHVYAVPRPGVSLETLEKAVDQVLGGMTARAAARPPTWPAPRPSWSPRSPIAATASIAWPRAYGQALVIGLTVDDVNEWPARIRAVNAAGVQQRRRQL